MLRLHRALKQKGISPKVLFQYLGISQRAYYMRVNGEVDFTYKEYKAIQEFLPDMNADYLLSEEEGTAAEGK